MHGTRGHCSVVIFNVIFEMCDDNVSPNNKFKSTPPTNKKVRNPFDKALVDRLHKPICSPGMYKIYKKKHNGLFGWDIDQACALVPADIVACNSQFEPTPDPALEKIAEEATDKFFSQELVLPSPLESSKKTKPSTMSSNTIIKSYSLVMRDVSAQTVLTLPPVLPPEVENVLKGFCTYHQEQNTSMECEIRRQLFFEEQSDMEHHYDSEQTDDEVPVEKKPPSCSEAHTPIIFSPDLSRDLVTKGMKRTFGTPMSTGDKTKAYRNKILDVVDYGEPCCSPINFLTPKRLGPSSATSSSLASVSISPVTKVTSSDEEKNDFTSPESDMMAVCLECVASEPNTVKKGPCFCKKTPNKYIIKRSASLKDSPQRSRKGSISFSEKRSLSMSSLHRSRSVQKLDFSMDMSVDGSFHDHSQADSESSPPQDVQAGWLITKEDTITKLVEVKTYETHGVSSTKTGPLGLLADTPIKVKSKSNVLYHEITKIRAPPSPMHISLDSSIDSIDNPLGLEDKKIDFNTVDLKFLTENVSQFNYTQNVTKAGGESSSSFKKVDSGFNENTFYANASSYYESAIKPSELTVTNMSKASHSTNALKEISNVNWMRLDSGFKDETSGDSFQFYNENSKKFGFSEDKLEDKENVSEKFLGKALQQNDALSMSDIFTDDMTFNCNFSSTPSKNKTRKVHS